MWKKIAERHPLGICLVHAGKAQWKEDVEQKMCYFPFPTHCPPALSCCLPSSSKNVKYAPKRLVYECKQAAIKMCVEQAYDIRAGKGVTEYFPHSNHYELQVLVTSED